MPSEPSAAVPRSSRWGAASLSLSSPRVLAGMALFAVLVSVWVRPPPPLLSGADAACYARVAREMVERPLGEWFRVTLGGEDFYEHPPLAMWLESGLFRLLGVSAANAVLFARLLASLLVVLVFAVARRVADARAAVLSVLGLPLLAGFLFESQNPMLELPLTVALGIAVLGAVSLADSPRRGAVLFAVGFAAGVFIKGPPALAVFPVLAWAGWRMRVPVRTLALAAGLAVGLLALCIGAFEWARVAHGLPPFFSRYFAHQVLKSALEGRHHAVRSPFFYVEPMKRWYLAGLLAVPLAAWAWLRHRREGLGRLAELGLLFVAVIVAGFSVPVQKYFWYIHPTMLGCAWLLGVALAGLLPVRWERWVCLLGVVAALGYAVALHVVPPRVSSIGRELEAVHTLPPPAFAPGQPRRIADCTQALGEWKATHLFAFLWSAERVPCDAPAAWRMEGTSLVAASPAP